MAEDGSPGSGWDQSLIALMRRIAQAPKPVETEAQRPKRPRGKRKKAVK